MNNNTKKPFNILGILFLIYFFGSILSLIIVPDNYKLAVFGQVFFVFGLLALFSKLVKEADVNSGDNKDKIVGKLIGLLFAVIGLVVLIIGIDINIGGRLTNYILSKPILLLSPFYLSGLGIVVYNSYDIYRLKRNCTFNTNAECIDIKVTGDSESRQYIPIYRLYLADIDGNNIVVKGMGTGKPKVNVGDTYSILVNPDNPKEILDTSVIQSRLALIIFGSIFLVFSIFIIIKTAGF